MTEYMLPTGINDLITDYVEQARTLRYRTQDLNDLRINYNMLVARCTSVEQELADAQTRLMGKLPFGVSRDLGLKIGESILKAHPAVYASIREHAKNNKKIQAIKEIRDFFTWYLNAQPGEYSLERELLYTKTLYEFMDKAWTSMDLINNAGDPWETPNEPAEEPPF
jgi:hypothetical protein